MERRSFLKLGGAALAAAVLGPVVGVFADGLNQIEVEPILSNEEQADIQRLIEKYGVAKSIPAMEYYGDYFNMYPGYYMNPEYFASQMQWLHDNEIHAVTGEELIGYLNGTIDLPGRSVILTTDSGVSSINSLGRMIPILQKTGMHFISFIWTQGMDEGQSSASNNDATWKAFRDASESGVFSFGSHTETHRNFGKTPEKVGLLELRRSIDHIEDKLGIRISGLSWPYEVCAYSYSQLKDLGFEYAFGGTSRPLMEMTVYPKDSLRYCLPRILPPAPNGVSGRPNNLTIEDIMKRYTTFNR